MNEQNHSNVYEWDMWLEIKMSSDSIIHRFKKAVFKQLN